MARGDPPLLTDIAQYEAELVLEETLRSRMKVQNKPALRTSPSYSEGFEPLSEERAAELEDILRKDKAESKSAVAAGATFGVIGGAIAGFWKLPGLFLGPKAEVVPKDREMKALLYRRARNDSRPGGDRLVALDPHLNDIFTTLVDQEHAASGHPTWISDLILMHATRIEAVLHKTLWTGSDEVMEKVGAHLDAGQIQVIRKAQQTGQPTLGTYGLFAVGCHRALKAGDARVAAWVCTYFQEEVSRYVGENAKVTSQLSTGSLARFIGRFRDRHRNPLAHGLPMAHQDETSYSDFCDFAYATQSLKQWMDVGVSPSLHAPQTFGWISFLVSARKTDT